MLNPSVLSLKGGKSSTIIGACVAMGGTGAILEAYNYNIFGLPGFPAGFRQDREKIKAATTQKEIGSE